MDTITFWFNVLSYGTIGVFGLVGNILTLLMLKRMRIKLSKAFDPLTRQLMVGLTWCDLIESLVALISTWNYLVGNDWPFSLRYACTYTIFFNCLNYVSIFHHVLISILRFFAVMYPTGLQAIMRAKCAAQGCVLLFPWFAGHVVFALGYWCSWYRVAYVEQDRNCYYVAFNDNSTASLANFAVFSLVDGIVNFICPITLGCVLYSIILWHLYWRRHARRGRSRIIMSKALSIRSNDVQVVHHGPTLQERQFRAICIVALAMVAQMLLMYPTIIFFAFGPHFNVDITDSSLYVQVFMAMYYSAFSVTPVVYALSSRDMRRAYRHYIVLIWKLARHKRFSTHHGNNKNSVSSSVSSLVGGQQKQLAKS